MKKIPLLVYSGGGFSIHVQKWLKKVKYENYCTNIETLSNILLQHGLCSSQTKTIPLPKIKNSLPPGQKPTQQSNLSGRKLETVLMWVLLRHDIRVYVANELRQWYPNAEDIGATFTINQNIGVC